MKFFQGLLCLLVAAVVMSHAIAALGAEKKIAVLTWSDEARYQESVKGLLDELKKAGFREPAVRFMVENARANKAKAVDAVRRFAAAKPDLIVSVGTTATIAVTREIKDIPVVFSMVYDPVEVKIAKGWKSSGNNTTGVSPRVPMAKLVRVVMDAAPVKKLAVLYTPGEKNSEIQLKELQGLQGSLGFTVIPVSLTRAAEVQQLLPAVVRTADAIYLSGSSVVGNEVTSIVNLSRKGKVVTVSHLDDLVDKGVLLGVSAEPYLVGRLAGEKAAKVLRGTKPAAIPIESLKKVEVILNATTAKAGQYQLQPSFLKRVTETVR